MRRLTVAVLVMIPVCLLVGCQRRIAIIEIPYGYTGWVTIGYSQGTCPDADQGRWVSVIRVQIDGSGCSRNWNGAVGLTYVRKFYVDTNGVRTRELKSTGWGEGGEIWGGSSTPADNEYHFFVGSEEKFRAVKTGPGIRRPRQR